MITERPCYDNSLTAAPGNAVFLVCTCDEDFGDDQDCAFHGLQPEICPACWRPLEDNLEPGMEG